MSFSILYPRPSFCSCSIWIHTQCFSFTTQARIGCSSSFFQGHISGPELTSCDYLYTVHSNTIRERIYVYIFIYINRALTHTHTHPHTPLLHQPRNYIRLHLPVSVCECVNATYASVRVRVRMCVYGEGFSLGVVFHICGPVEYDECAWHSLLSSVKRFNGISESEQPSLAPAPAQTKLPLFSSPIVPYLRVLPAYRPERRTFFEKGKCMCLTVAIYCSAPPPPPSHLSLLQHPLPPWLVQISDCWKFHQCAVRAYIILLYIRTTTATATATTTTTAVAAVVEDRLWTWPAVG